MLQKDLTSIEEGIGSYSSRKFILTIVALVLITGMSLLNCWVPGVAAVLPTFVGGIMGAMGLYFGGNIANKYLVGKAIESTSIVTSTISTEEVSAQKTEGDIDG